MRIWHPLSQLRVVHSADHSIFVHMRTKNTILCKHIHVRIYKRSKIVENFRLISKHKYMDLLHVALQVQLNFQTPTTKIRSMIGSNNVYITQKGEKNALLNSKLNSATFQQIFSSSKNVTLLMGKFLWQNHNYYLYLNA